MAILIKVVVAEPCIDRKADAVRRQSLSGSGGELQQLGALVRLRDLPAAVVGHVSADHHPSGRAIGWPAPRSPLGAPPISCGQRCSGRC